jgi:hypothetical protein
VRVAGSFWAKSSAILGARPHSHTTYTTHHNLGPRWCYDNSHTALKPPVCISWRFPPANSHICMPYCHVPCSPLPPFGTWEGARADTRFCGVSVCYITQALTCPSASYSYALRRVSIAHLADHVPCGWDPITFLIARFIHSRLVLWNKNHQARLLPERKSRIHSNGPIQRTKIHSPSCT